MSIKLSGPSSQSHNSQTYTIQELCDWNDISNPKKFML